MNKFTAAHACSYWLPPNAAASAFSLFSSSFTLALCGVGGEGGGGEGARGHRVLRARGSACRAAFHLDGNQLGLGHDLRQLAAVTVDQAELGQHFLEGRHVRSLGSKGQDLSVCCL